MKKNYNKPELNVLHIGKEICTQDIIAVSNQSFSNIDDVGAAGRRFDDWNQDF